MKFLKIVGILYFSSLVFSCGESTEKKKGVLVECLGDANCASGKCNLVTHRCVNGPNNGTTNPNNGTSNPNNGTSNPNNGTSNPNNGTSNPNNGTSNSSPMCGNDKVEGNEICDGNCPTQCDDMDTCTSDTLQGDAQNCDAMCVHNAVTACVDGDGCCAPGCDPSNDLDCVTCGNGVLDGNETCDKKITAGMEGACVTQCGDNDACTIDTLVGSSDQCSAACSNIPQTSCVDGDGCCPSNCGGLNDSDCLLNGTIFGGACTTDAECGNGNTCLLESTSGNPGGFCSGDCQSDAECGTHAFCSDGICLPSCANDADCRSGYKCSNFYGTGNTCNRDTSLAPPGSVCMFDGDCQSSVFGASCIKESTNPSFSGGYCTLFCLGDDTCQTGSTCVGLPNNQTQICADKCTSHTDCRSGYLCFDREMDGQKECWPGATGTGVTGSPCNVTQDCSGGVDGFCTRSQNFLGGYCTADCSQNGCAAGAVCSIVGDRNICLDSCDPNNNTCRNGYGCFDTDGNGTNECFPIASGSAGVGDPCTQVQNCAGGPEGYCFLGSGFTDGYCTIDCTNDSNLCGAGNCVSNSSMTTSFCLDNCTSAADCRAGYSCVDTGGASSCLPSGN